MTELSPQQEQEAVNQTQNDNDEHGEDGKAFVNSASRMLAEKIKLLEAEWDKCLPADKPFVIRLDGHGFSKFIRLGGYKKPFDERIAFAMVQTTIDLVNELNAVLGFTES